MPVFNLELQFDSNGAAVAVRQINKVTEAAEEAEDAVVDLGRSGKETGKALDTAFEEVEDAVVDLGDAVKKVGKELNTTCKDAEKHINNVGKAARKTGKDLEAVIGEAGNEAEQVAENLGNTQNTLLASLTTRAKAVIDGFGNARDILNKLFKLSIPTSIVGGLASLASSANETKDKMEELERQYDILGVKAHCEKLSGNGA